MAYAIRDFNQDWFRTHIQAPPIKVQWMVVGGFNEVSLKQEKWQWKEVQPKKKRSSIACFGVYG